MNIKACLEYLERLAALRPKYPDTRYNLGLALSHIGRHEDALEAFDAALAVHPQYLDAAISRCFLMTELSRAAEGFRDFRRLHVRSPEDFTVVFALGIFCMRNGWKDAGREQILRAESFRPRVPYVVLHAAAALFETGDTDAAQKRMDQARETVETMGIEPLRGGFTSDLSEIEFYRRWQDPCAAKIHIVLANFLSGEGDPEGAENELTHACSKLPGHAGLMAHLGRLLLARGKTDEAARWLSASIRLDPSSYQAYVELSFLHAESRDVEAAEASLRKATALRPLFPDLRLHLGTLLAEAGKLDAAIEEFKRALAINPAYGHSALHLANAYLEKGASTDAIAVLAASPHHADWPEALVLSARAHLRDGQDLRARSLLEKALKIDPSNGEARELLVTLSACV